MRPARPTSRTLALLLAAALADAQTTAHIAPKPAPVKPAPKPPSLPFNPNVIFLDPAHGGSDIGAHLTEDSLEKDATLAFAKLLRTLLTPRGFTVVLTHESAAIPVAPPPPQPLEDGTIPPTPPFNPAANNPSLDGRVEQANRSHAVACILIHASNGGHGVHLYTSSLTPAPPPDPTLDPALRPLIPWDSAQASFLPQSIALAADLATALNGIRVPLVTAHASIRPIDSMTCAAVILELSPLSSEGQTPASDPAYQGRVASAIATALDIWRGHAQSQAIAAQASRDANAKPAAGKPPTVPTSKPRPKSIPQENPLSDAPASGTPRKPAPVIRQTSPPPPGANP